MSRPGPRRGAVVLVAVLLGLVGAAGPVGAQTERDLAVTLLDGAAVTTRTLFPAGTLAPGASLTDALVVTTRGDVRGPLELRLVPRAEPTAFEADLELSSTVDGRTVRSPLVGLLRGGATLPVAELRGPGQVQLDLAVTFVAGSPNATRRESTAFDLVLTVRGEEVLVPGPAPEVEGVAVSRPPGLAATGAGVTVLVVLGALAVGSGAAVLLGSRRRSG